MNQAERQTEPGRQTDRHEPDRPQENGMVMPLYDLKEFVFGFP